MVRGIRRIAAFLCVMVPLSAGLTAANAEEPTTKPEKKKSENIQGKILSIEPTLLTIQPQPKGDPAAGDAAAIEPRGFILSPKTRVFIAGVVTAEKAGDGKPVDNVQANQGKLSDLKPGQNAIILYGGPADRQRAIAVVVLPDADQLPPRP